MENVTLREFEPLTKLLRTVPNKVQKAFRSHPIDWTSIDVTEQYIAVGCNAGVVFLFDRNTQKLQRLECKNPHDVVTTIKMCQSVDYLVAVGTALGYVCIFQLPSILPGRNKQLQKYEVEDLHHSEVTCLMWSQNAMKLFSGDEDGIVYCSEIDYDKYTSQSYFVHKEAHEIVQFDYSSRVLLISSRFRTILLNFADKSQVQVGTKDRKLLGNFGAVFLPGAYQQAEKVLFAARPGFRLWKASGKGAVDATYIFKDLLKYTSEGIALLGDTLHGIQLDGTQEDKQFGPLYMYQDTLLVTHNDSSVYVIDPGLGKFIGYCANLGKVVGVAVCKDEIFILRRDGLRKVIRIAQTSDLNARTPSPPVQSTTTMPAENAPSHRPVEIMSHTAHSVLGAFKGMSDKFIASVQEGQKPKPPPWGIVGEHSVEEGKEIGPSQSPSPEAAPTSLDIPNDMESTTTGSYQSDEVSVSEHSQATVRQNSRDGSSQGLLSYTAPGGPQTITPELIHRAAPLPLDDSDIVFQNYGKKTKQKHPKKKGKGKDKDASSVSSLDLQSLPESTLTSQPGEMPDQNQPNACSDQRSINVTDETAAKDFNEQNSNKALECVPSIVDDSTKIIADISENPKARFTTRRDLESELTALPWQQDRNDKRKGDSDHNLCVNDIPDDCDSNNKILEPNENDSAENSATNEESLVTEKSNFLTTDYSQCNAKSISPEALNIEIPEKPSILEIATGLPSSTENVTREKVDKTKPKTENVNSTIASMGTVRKKVLSSTSSEDEDSIGIYDVYASPTSPVSSPLGNKIGGKIGFGRVSNINLEETSLEDAVEQTDKEVQKEKQDKATAEAEEGECDLGTLSQAGTWNEFSVPGNLQCVCVTFRHAWIVDKSERLHYSYLEGPGLRWHRVQDAPAQLISVSPSGNIVWRMYRGMLYAGTKITTRAPAGLKWEDFVQSGVVHMSVDETMGWYVKANGELVLHKNLTRERPCNVPVKVPCEQRLVKVECNAGVVWALTEDHSLVVRMGLKKGKEEGDSWHYLGSGGPSQLVAGFSLGEEETAWVIDVVGRLWFMTGVRPNKPQGDGQWWQVSLTEYLMQDATAFGILATISDYPQKLFQYVQQSDGGGLVFARCNGVWACPGHKNILHVCRGGLLGHRWETLSLPGIAPAITWKHICAAGLSETNGYIWTQQPNGGIFCFNPQRSARTLKVMEVRPPEPEEGVPALCMSVAQDVVWVLMPKGNVYVRAGIHSSCPQGVKWLDLDLTQLGSRARFVWLCCGGQNVWALDNKGKVYLRIGVHAPTNQLLNPAWVPVEGVPQTLGARFVKVVTGPNDWMVWAIDSVGYVYVRKGVTDSMPIGSHWVYVPGSTASDVIVGESYVYARTSEGEILIRCGVTEDNVMGNCWSKVPGVLTSLSAAREGDGLWGINNDGQLCRRFTHYLHKKLVLSKLQSVVKSDEGDWQLI